VFQNIGDGTYNHSGYMAIRAAIASGVNITYKVLFNDAVAMTGGQPNDGGLTVPQVARQVAAEGAARVVVVTDEPKKYSSDERWPAGLTIHHRDDLMQVQEDLAKIPGVTVLIYDQTCAARTPPPEAPLSDRGPVIISALSLRTAGTRRELCVSVRRWTEWGASAPSTSRAATSFSCVKSSARPSSPSMAARRNAPPASPGRRRCRSSWIRSCRRSIRPSASS
jgi:indolepyruvate ferredoxin oxidoreductase